MVDLRFDHYHDYDEMTDILHAFAKEFPDLSEIYSIGQSTEGRELWLIEITNKETGPAEEKPAVYVDANTHAAELTRYAYGSDVETVIIDGEIVMEDRIIKTLDEGEILAKAKRIGEEVYEETKDRMSKTVPVNRWKVI